MEEEEGKEEEKKEEEKVGEEGARGREGTVRASIETLQTVGLGRRRGLRLWGCGS